MFAWKEEIERSLGTSFQREQSFLEVVLQNSVSLSCSVQMFAYGLAVRKAPYCYGWNKMRILKYLYATSKYDYGKHSFLKLYDLLFMQEDLKEIVVFVKKKKNSVTPTFSCICELSSSGISL